MIKLAAAVLLWLLVVVVFVLCLATLLRLVLVDRTKGNQGWGAERDNKDDEHTTD